MQKILLSIPEPCHESWQKMSPTEQGRFCNACAKEVIDFSSMTDQQVLNYFTTASNEKICGRVLSTQLDNPIVRPVQPKKRLFWYWNYLVMFFMFFSKSNNVNAQTKGKVVAVPLNNQSCTKTMGTMVAGVNVQQVKKTITGKIKDDLGNNVSFATIRVKGTKIGTSADQNGLYSIVTDVNDELEISAVGYESKIFSLKSLTSFDFILHQAQVMMSGEIVVTGGVYARHCTAVRSGYMEVFKIKDSVSGLPMNNVSVVVNKIGSTKYDSSFTDKKGIYKLKRIKEDDGYHVRVFTKGYEANEFTISGKEFNDRKEAWEVYLKKTVITQTVTLGQIAVNHLSKDPVYVLDGIIVPGLNNINPDNIESVNVLQGPAAVAIYGSQATGGAIVITTKKKSNDLDTVVIKGSTRKRMVQDRTVAGTILTPDASLKVVAGEKYGFNITNEENIPRLKLYPNPVHQGLLFNVIIKLPEPGKYSIQVVDVSGQVVLQKLISATANEYAEQIQTDSKWSSGIYHIRVLDNKNKTVNTNSFIVL
jgi:TonB-dependent SusC/RagA subfamily outer membrane receptor